MRKQIQLSLSAAEAATLDGLASQAGLSRSALVRVMMDNYLAEGSRRVLACWNEEGGIRPPLENVRDTRTEPVKRED